MSKIASHKCFDAQFLFSVIDAFAVDIFFFIMMSLFNNVTFFHRMFRSNDYICKYHRSMLRLLLNNKLFLIAFENFPHLSNNVHGNSSRKNMNFKSFLSFCNFNDLQILYAKMQKNFIALNRNENSI